MATRVKPGADTAMHRAVTPDGAETTEEYAIRVVGGRGRAARRYSAFGVPAGRKCESGWRSLTTAGRAALQRRQPSSSWIGFSPVSTMRIGRPPGACTHLV
jgi:hypothetical protein